MKKISSVVGNYPITLLFCIYIILFIIIEFISIKLAVITSVLIIVILALLKKDKFIEIVIISFLLLTISIYLLPSQVEFGTHTIVGEIKNIDYNYFDIKVEKSDNQKIKRPTYVRVYNSISNKKIGSKCLFKLELERIKKASNPGEFSNKNYLNSLGITAISSSYELIQSVKPSKIKYHFIKIRSTIIDKLEVLPVNERGLLIAMLLGDKSKLGKETKNSYETSGLAHLLVVSGLHLTILVTVIKLILGKLNVKQTYQTLVIIILIWCYAFLTGFRFSIIRAGLMISSYIIFKNFNKKITKIDNISLAAIIILVIYPYALKNIGWQLSFSATFGILTFSKKIMKRLPDYKISKPLSVIISAQIMTLPIVINNFNQISLMLIPANLLIVPITTLILIIGLASLLPIVSFVFISLIDTLLSWHIILASWFASFDNLVIFIKDWPTVLVIIYYVLIFVLFHTSLINLKKLLTCVFVFILIFFNIDFRTEVVFLDVGQGDSAFIETSIFDDNMKMLIDCGDTNEYSDSGNEVLVPFLKSRGIKKLDYLFLSHAHKDHIGGAISLLEEIDVGEVCMSLRSLNYESETLEKLIRKCKDKEIRIKLLFKGKNMQISEDVIIKVLHPKLKVNYSQNNSSLVLNLFLDGINILFTGDIEKEAEIHLVNEFRKNLAADIIKIPHHGSKSSSSEKFLNYVNPIIAINSSDKDHFLNHPDNEVILRYNNRKTNLFRTDIDGAITITIKDYIDIECYLSKKEDKIWLSQQWMS